MSDEGSQASLNTFTGTKESKSNQTPKLPENNKGKNNFSSLSSQMLKRLPSNDYFEGVNNPEQLFGANLQEIMTSFALQSNDEINLSDLATPKLASAADLNERNFPEITPMNMNMNNVKSKPMNYNKNGSTSGDNVNTNTKVPLKISTNDENEREPEQELSASFHRPVRHSPTHARTTTTAVELETQAGLPAGVSSSPRRHSSVHFTDPVLEGDVDALIENAPSPGPLYPPVNAHGRGMSEIPTYVRSRFASKSHGAAHGLLSPDEHGSNISPNGFNAQLGLQDLNVNDAQLSPSGVVSGARVRFPNAAGTPRMQRVDSFSRHQRNFSDNLHFFGDRLDSQSEIDIDGLLNQNVNTYPYGTEGVIPGADLDAQFGAINLGPTMTGNVYQTQIQDDQYLYGKRGSRRHSSPPRRHSLVYPGSTAGGQLLGMPDDDFLEGYNPTVIDPGSPGYQNSYYPEMEMSMQFPQSQGYASSGYLQQPIRSGAPGLRMYPSSSSYGMAQGAGLGMQQTQGGYYGAGVGRGSMAMQGSGFHSRRESNQGSVTSGGYGRGTYLGMPMPSAVGVGPMRGGYGGAVGGRGGRGGMRGGMPPMGPTHISPNMCLALQEYRASGQRPTLEALMGHVVEFSRDSHGSRFIQFKMETASEMEKQLLVEEILPDAVSLAAHPFGNYVVQNFLQHSTAAQREALGMSFKTHMTQLSIHPHGCRVVQFALDTLKIPLRNDLLMEIVENIEQISKNNHGTHVVQKCMTFLNDEVNNQSKQVEDECRAAGSYTSQELLSKVETIVQAAFIRLAIHPHSYRLVQLTLSDCNENRSSAMKSILKQITENYQALAEDQHGNFILQHILDFGTKGQADDVQKFVCSRVLLLSQHKFGSHLVEKSLSKANAEQIKNITHQILIPTEENLAYFNKKARSSQQVDISAGKANILSDDEHKSALLMLCKDPYGNFVVQKILDLAGPNEKAMLYAEVSKRADILSRFAYGRHILAHLNRADFA